MLIKRTITTLVLAAIGIPVIILGGPYYFALITFFLAVAGWEYGQMFSKAGCKVPVPFLIGCVVLIAVMRGFLPNLAAAALTLSVFAAMTWHLVDYERDVTWLPQTLPSPLPALFTWVGLGPI